MNEEVNVLDYRLKSIEEEIKSLKELLIKVPVMNNDIENIEHRVNACELNIDSLLTEITKLKNEPIKKNAEKWQFIMDFIFKSVITVIVGYFLVKVGLK